MTEYCSLRDQKIILGDGRALGYAEYGDLAGSPLMVFPGAPSSRLIPLDKRTAATLGIRLIVVERPGFGLSDFKKDRTLLDWPTDIEQLCDALDLTQFHLAGISAGGPYALVCAHHLPERIHHTAIIASLGPLDHPQFVDEMPAMRKIAIKVARIVPDLFAGLLNIVFNPQRDPEKFYTNMLSGNSEKDQEFLQEPQVKNALMKNYLEATRDGMRGFAREGVILSGSWGFDLEEIIGPVDIWFGEDDKNVSLSAVNYMAGKIPRCKTHFIPNQGHWLHLSMWPEILKTLFLIEE